MSIEFFLDGKAVSAEPGQTIMDAAKANGIVIPGLCGDPRISKTTSCFVCVVKDKKTGKFLPSCSARPAPGQEIEVTTPEVLDMRRTALELLLSEHTGDCEAPCTIACPAHAQVEEYVRLIANGEFEKGLAVIKERIPMPMSVGRVCPRFCEKQCRRNIDGKPVAINEFKRLAADLCYDSFMEEIPADCGKKVAVVGGGPAGLAAAYYLRLQGVAVTVFDAQDDFGGMTRYGIPEYRLPKAILSKEVAHFAQMGIELVPGKKLGENLDLAELKAAYDAVVIAIGCWKASGLRCEGEELATPGIEFLHSVAVNNNTGKNPGRTLVIGGGNTAMDCVRTSVRLGSSDVTCSYRRTEAEMPAEKIEIAEAKEEGVKFQFLTAPVKLEKRGTKLILTCLKMELGEPDASGRRKPVAVPGSEFEIEADTVISAIGQGTDAPAGVPVDRYGNLAVKAENTTRVEDKIYAAGDCAYGARTVVEALASGRLAALEIAEDILNKAMPAENSIFISRGSWQEMSQDEVVVLRNDLSSEPRVELKFIPLEERKNSFKEVCATITPEEAASEGKRCIECSCSDKSDCKLRKFADEAGCRKNAYAGERQLASYDLRHPDIVQDRGKCIKCTVCVKVCKEVVNQSLLSLQKRGFQANIGTAFNQGLPLSCKDCGACIESCPTGALDWRKKR